MGIEERQQLAVEGIVVAAVDVMRGVMAGSSPQGSPSSSAADVSSAVRPSQLKAQIRVTTRAMWVDNGRLLEVLHKVGSSVVLLHFISVAIQYPSSHPCLLLLLPYPPPCCKSIPAILVLTLFHNFLDPPLLKLLLIRHQGPTIVLPLVCCCQVLYCA